MISVILSPVSYLLYFIMIISFHCHLCIVDCNHHDNHILHRQSVGSGQNSVCVCVNKAQ